MVKVGTTGVAWAALTKAEKAAVAKAVNSLALKKLKKGALKVTWATTAHAGAMA